MDSLCDSMVLVVGHEQTDTCDLPHDELAFLQCGPEAARVAAGVCQVSCPPISCGVSDFRGAGFAFRVQPDGSGGLPVARFS